MTATRIRAGLLALALAILLPAFLSAAPVPEEEALKTEAVRLNDVNGDEQIDKKIEEYSAKQTSLTESKKEE